MTPTSDIFIQGTETDPDVLARGELREIHRELQTRLDTFTEPGETPDDADRFRAALVAFCRAELRGYLAASRQTLWSTAAGAAASRLTILLVRVGNAARSVLEEHIDMLEAADDATVTQARAIQGAFRIYLETEETALVPALTELATVDLRTLITDLNTLRVEGKSEDVPVIDVREIPRRRRHPRIFTRFARLAPGESFFIVNDHDPKPLRQELDAAFADAFHWQYVESGPEKWRIRIGRNPNDD